MSLRGIFAMEWNDNCLSIIFLWIGQYTYFAMEIVHPITFNFFYSCIYTI